MGLANIDPMPLDAIVPEQRIIRCCEFLVARKVVDRRGEAITTDPPGDPPADKGCPADQSKVPQMIPSDRGGRAPSWSR